MCIEIALWDRFNWGPEQTRALKLSELRVLFAILEQQQVSNNYKHEMGPGTEARHRALVEANNNRSVMEASKERAAPRAPASQPAKNDREASLARMREEAERKFGKQ